MPNLKCINIIKNKYGTGNNVIVISNRLNNGNNNGAEIMYPLRSNSRLASSIAGNLEAAGQPVLKYYQLRNSDMLSTVVPYLLAIAHRLSPFCTRKS